MVLDCWLVRLFICWWCCGVGLLVGCLFICWCGVVGVGLLVGLFVHLLVVLLVVELLVGCCLFICWWCCGVGIVGWFVC